MEPIHKAVPAAVSDDRPVLVNMTKLASQIGDLDTAVRCLAKRIAVALPGGSPYERPEKQPTDEPINPVPRPVHSHLTDELESRTFQLREITERLKGMTQAIEL